MLKTSDLKKRPGTKPAAPAPGQPDQLAQMQAAMAEMATAMGEMAKAIKTLAEQKHTGER